MADLIPVPKTNFFAGEIHPSLFPRIDLPQYAMGAKTIKNSIVLPTGGVSNRPGTEYINAVKGVGTNVITESFSFPSGDKYVLEFGNLYIRFYKDGAVLGAPYEVVTPYLSADLVNLRFVQSADIILILSPIYQPRLLAHYSDTSWLLAAYDYENGPYMPLNDDATITITPSATTGNITLTSTNNIFSNITDQEHASNRTLWQINHLVPSQIITQSFSATGASGSIECGGTWRIVTHGTWTATVQVEISLDGGSSWIPVRVLASRGTMNYDTYGVEDYSQFLVRVNCTSYTSGPAYVDISTDAFIWNGVVKITQVPAGGGGSSQMYATADATVLTTLQSATATADWAEGSWSKYRGYPGKATFYHDRLVFAETVSEPQTIWATQTGVYLDFGRSSPLLDSDGITINLPSRTLESITAVVSLTNLLVLTTGAEWSIGPAPGTGALTPFNVEIHNHGHNGAANIEPVIIGNRAIYIQASRASLRDTGYSEEANGFVGNNLSKDSMHLLDGYTIIDMAYQKIPYSIIWLLRSDGKLLSLTYDHPSGINAWALHDTKIHWIKAGYELDIYCPVESLCVLPNDGCDEVWFVIDRRWTLYSLGTRNIERVTRRSISEMPEDQYFVDGGGEWAGDEKTIAYITAANPAVFGSTAHGLNNGDVVRIDGINNGDAVMEGLNDGIYNVYDASADNFKLKHGATGSVPVDTSGASAAMIYPYTAIVKKTVNTLTGLSQYFDYTELDVLVDGVPNKVIIGGGAFTLSGADNYGSYIKYGHNFKSDVELIPINLAGQQSLLGISVDIMLASVWLFRSLGGKIGPDEDHLQLFLWPEGDELLPRYTTAPFRRELYSGNVDVSVDTKNEANRTLLIRQEEPLPMTILAIIPHVSIPKI